MFENRITDDVKSLIKDYIKEGQTVVDLTTGNGHDTMFLAEHVGPIGKVYSFDIQEKAIITTKNKLEENKLLNRVTLIHDGHENIDQYIKDEKISIAMMNLGYLPNGDKRIITKPDTTIQAIKKVLKQFKKNSICSIITYYGHEGGSEERKALEEFLMELDNKYYNVLQLAYFNRGNQSPIIYIILCIRNAAK